MLTLFQLPGVTSKNVGHDALRVIFTKGILAYFLGSVLLMLCYKEGRGRQAEPPEGRLAEIFRLVQVHYTQHRATTRLTNLKLSMFLDPKKPHADYPFFGVKAGECKHFLPAIYWVMQQSDDGSELHKHILAAMKAVLLIVLVIDQSSWVLTPKEHRTVMAEAAALFDPYQSLHEWAEETGRWLFNIVPKFHTFAHLCLNSQWLSPRVFWCFRSEDYVGKISKLAKSSSFGVRSTKLSVKIAAKYRVLLHLRMTRPLADCEAE